MAFCRSRDPGGARRGTDRAHPRASSAAAALECAAKSIPDIVLIDLNLPDMHGYGLAERLRQKPEFANTILIALTGFGLTGDPERSAAVGIDAHFRKPMDFSELPNIRRRQ